MLILIFNRNVHLVSNIFPQPRNISLPCTWPCFPIPYSDAYLSQPWPLPLHQALQNMPKGVRMEGEARGNDQAVMVTRECGRENGQNRGKGHCHSRASRLLLHEHGLGSVSPSNLRSSHVRGSHRRARQEAMCRTRCGTPRLEFYCSNAPSLRNLLVSFSYVHRAKFIAFQKQHY